MAKYLAERRVNAGRCEVSIPEQLIHPAVNRELFRTMIVDKFDPVEYTHWAIDDPYGNGVGVDINGDELGGVYFIWY